MQPTAQPMLSDAAAHTLVVSFSLGLLAVFILLGIWMWRAAK
jgi:type IV secretory pathway TrbL component